MCGDGTKKKMINFSHVIPGRLQKKVSLDFNDK